jgi:hypothetical protein
MADPKFRGAHMLATAPEWDCPDSSVSGRTRRAVAWWEGSLMHETLVGVSSPASPEEPQEPRPPSAEELAAARELVRAARDRGVALAGPDGLLKALTKTVVETAPAPTRALDTLHRRGPTLSSLPCVWVRP